MIKRRVIGIIGTFDSKTQEFAVLRQLILKQGFEAYTIDIGVYHCGAPFPIDYRVCNVQSSSRTYSSNHRSLLYRDRALREISENLTRELCDIARRAELVGIVGMGGARGSGLIAKAFQKLPLSFPKVLVSTCAGLFGDTYIGSKDTVLIPAVVDIAGVNAITTQIFSWATAIVCSLANVPYRPLSSGRTIAITMLGNTTRCCDACRIILERNGFETVTLHANGIGGRLLQDYIAQGRVNGVLDVTTCEVGNEMFGGIFTAGKSRLIAGIRKQIPVVIAPGGLDFLVLRAPSAQFARYRGRSTYKWTDHISLVRTSVRENRLIALMWSNALKHASGPFCVLLTAPR